MKDLKYIKLYEAFESNKLTKTVAYLKGEDKKKFLSKLKQVCDAIDFPYSKLTDEYFEYLPFKAALEKNFKISVDTYACTAKSEDLFGSAGIPGERCKNGKILRTWGKKSREVTCSVCNGTGIKPKSISGEIGLIKFWFNQNGEYAALTACDGVARDSSKNMGKFSRNIEDYDIVKNINTLKDTSLLQTGDIVSVRLVYGKKDTVCYCWRVGINLYLLQDVSAGGYPADNWRDVGTKYSYAIGNGSLSGKLLALKQPAKDPSKALSPYDLNTGISVDDGKIRQIPVDIRNELKNANFAIVFDFAKIKSADFYKKSRKVLSRTNLKAGSKLDPLMSDDNIKKRNIEKYINEIAKSLDISTDITNCKKLTLRSFGSRNSLFLLLYQNINILSQLSLISDTYYALLSTNNNDTKEDIAKELKIYAENIFKSSSKISRDTANTLRSIEHMLAESRDVKGLELYRLCNQLSFSIEEMIKRSEVECIEDFEILIQKLQSIKLIIRSYKYNLSNVENYYIDQIRRSNPVESIRLISRDYSYGRTGYVEGLKRVIKIVERM